jgi:MFS family permease
MNPVDHTGRPPASGIISGRERQPGSAAPETGASPSAPKPAASLAAILHGRDFRLLWGGEFVSLLGDQFFLVAMPWLILQHHGALTIGGIVAVGAAPRTVFILIGGVLTDRFSPRTVMLYSNVVRMVLVAALALLTATGWIQLWMLYGFSLLLGLGYAFFLPAQSTIIPRLVPENRLQVGNAIIQATTQLTLFLGPVVAGVLIAVLRHKGAGAAGTLGEWGIGIVFALDAVSFLVSAVTLSLIRLPSKPAGERGPAGMRGVFRSLAEGLNRVWQDRTLRLYLVLIGAVNLALLGPLSVGIPILAHTRFSGGALAYGGILSGLGAGALAGAAAAGIFRRPPGRWFAVAMLSSTTLLGVGLALLGAFPSTGPAAAAAFIIGVAEGYLIVEFITWLQLRTPRDELGRILSILLFASVGMAPVSNVIAGALVGLNAPWVMIGAGCLIVLVAVIAAFSPAVWLLSENGVRVGGGPE